MAKQASWETLYSGDVMLIPHILEVPLESVVPALSSLNDTESAPMLALQCDESPVNSGGVVMESLSPV